MDFAAKKIEQLKTADLVPYARNARTHSEAQVAQIAGSIREFGFTNPVLIDNERGIIAGHGRVLAAQSLGLETVPCIRLGHLTESQRRAYVLADNRLALNAGWDAEMLAVELDGLKDAGVDLASLGFDKDELNELIGTANAPPDTPAAPAPEVAKSVIGDIWALGDHRLMCGDSTNATQVSALMGGVLADLVFTDPPYGVGYTGGAKKREALKGDEIGTEIYGRALPILKGAAADHAALYLWYADAHAAAAAAAAAGYVITAQIVWVKNNAQFVTSAHYKGKHEPCFYAHRKGKTARWVGENNEVTVWEVNRAHKNEFHPTQKPIELASRAMRNSTNPGDIVLDLFGGSGSTMIAAENLGRNARLMELHAPYCDVIVGRWQNHTGKKAVHAVTGEEFNART